MEKQYINSERAHYMCPNMYFGILIEINGILEKDRLDNCIRALADAHPFLKSVIKAEEGSSKLFYDVKNESHIEVKYKTDVDNMWDDYNNISLNEWNVFKNGLLKMYIYSNSETTKILFIAHHLLGDGRCLLELANEFANLYAENVKPGFAQENLIKGVTDLPAGSDLKGISKYLIKRVNKQWSKENHKVDYNEYSKFSDDFAAKNKVEHEVVSAKKDKLENMKKYCKSNDISVNDLLMAKIYLNMKVNKIIIAADIRNKISCYNKGACGNYATALGVICKKKTINLEEKVKEVSLQVKKQMKDSSKLMLVLSCYLNMNPDLLDAVAISSLGGYTSKAAKFVGDSMFGFKNRDGISLTNLGSIQNKNIVNAVFIPPASPATMQTIGALTVNDKMNLCSSYYSKALDSQKVIEQLNSLI